MVRSRAPWIVLPLLLAACGEAPLTPDLRPAGAPSASTAVPGHARKADANGNGYPDAGVVVTGKYVSIYAYDANGDYFWDLGDGRVQGTVGSVDALDAATLTECVYQVHYRGTFEDDPFQDTGWITNNINCKGLEHGTYLYQIVHATDPRYRGNPDWAVWGDWEYHVLTESGTGNLVRPYRPA